MSKTSDTNSIVMASRAFLKPFVVSATAFARKYRTDIFYRSSWNVIALQLLFMAILIVIVFLATSALYEQIVSGLIKGIAESTAAGTSPESTGFSITTALEYEKEKNLLLTATGVIIASVIFGYLTTHMALTPTRKALESQKQFIGNVAHELRTPLSIIKTNTEVALFNENLSPDIQEIFHSNVEELDRISDIINNLLSINTLIQPEKMEFKNIDLGIIVERVIATLESLATHKGIAITVTQSEYRTVWANASAVEQIIHNITKNALNYTKRGGTIAITINPDYHGCMIILIEDTGVGISEKDLEHIFEPFYRGDYSRNRKIGGSSGLGLAIVSELIKIHKGSIAIESEIAQGTRVKILLPTGRDDQTPKRTNGISMDFLRS